MNERLLYTTQQLVGALHDAGLQEGTTACVHVSLGRLGFNRAGQDALIASRELLTALTSVVGDQGTLLVPTYSYSIGRGEVFDPVTTPSTIGFFTEYVRTSPGWIRSREPMLAVSGRGPDAARLLGDLPRTSYGNGSLYARLIETSATVLTVGLDLHWATFRHHLEELSTVPFRRIKRFSGRLRNEDQSISEETWEYFAAPFLDCAAPDGTRLAKILRTEGFARVGRVGIGEVVGISARVYRDQTFCWLKKDPWFTAKGPPCPKEMIDAHMNPAPERAT